MLVEFLSTLFFIFNILLIILIIMQKNHGGFWSGPAGNDSVNIFGGNQGADVLQKITWAFGAILIFGCLFLSVYQASQSQISQFYLKEVNQEIINKKEDDKNTPLLNEEKNETLAENNRSELEKLEKLENTITNSSIETEKKDQETTKSVPTKNNSKKKTALNNTQKK